MAGRLLIGDGALLCPEMKRRPPRRPAQQRVCPRVARLHRDGAPEQTAGFLVLSALHLVDEAKRTHHESPGIDAVRLLAGGAEALFGVELGLHRGHDVLGDVVLDGEDVLQLAVVFLGPEMIRSAENPSALQSLMRISYSVL